MDSMRLKEDAGKEILLQHVTSSLLVSKLGQIVFEENESMHGVPTCESCVKIIQYPNDISFSLTVKSLSGVFDELG